MNGNHIRKAIAALINPGLLPIREAYEWKPLNFHQEEKKVIFLDFLLPIREAYEWKRGLQFPRGLSATLLASNS